MVRIAIKRKSLLITMDSKENGVIVEARPTTRSVLNRYDPIIFPRAISSSPFFTAAIHEASSGKLVPIATTVRPVIISLTPKNIVTCTAPQTKRRDEMIRKIIPNIT